MAVLQIFGADNSVVVPTWATESLASFREWYASDDFPEQGRICYLAGEVYVEMGHERVSSHVALKTALTEILSAFARAANLGRFFGDGIRLVNEGADLSSEPDCCFISWNCVKDGRVVLQQSSDGTDVTELVGSPDMVLEIVSPSSIGKDKKVLPEIYFQAGIPEYWLIDARKAEMYFTILKATPEGYIPASGCEGWLAGL